MPSRVWHWRGDICLAPSVFWQVIPTWQQEIEIPDWDRTRMRRRPLFGLHLNLGAKLRTEIDLKSLTKLRINILPLGICLINKKPTPMHQTFFHNSLYSRKYFLICLTQFHWRPCILHFCEITKGLLWISTDSLGRITIIFRQKTETVVVILIYEPKQNPKQNFCFEIFDCFCDRKMAA